MTEKAEITPVDSKRPRALLAATYLAAAGLGLVLGTQAPLPSSKSSTSTPLTRLGFALREQNPTFTPLAWTVLQSDVEAVRSTLQPQEREVLGLVAAVRGLTSAGDPDWAQAEQLCRALDWPRCDRAALEELQRRSRP